MSTTTILAGGAATMLGLGAIPFAVAGVASPINRARDARRYTAETAHADARTADLVAQIRAGADDAALVNSDTGKLAAAAYSAASALADGVADEDLALVGRILHTLEPILNAENIPQPDPSAAPPIAAAAALQLLLHRLATVCDGPRLAQVRIAGGYAAEAIRAIPDGAAVDFNPLGEFDPEPLRRAQAEWIATAKQAGMDGWIRAVHA